MKRRNYTPIRIDFTPFVNVALLLIVFFVWVKIAQRLNQMNLAMPDKSSCDTGYFINDMRGTTLTLYQIKNHQLIYTFGQSDQNSKLMMTCLHGCALPELLNNLSKKFADHFVIIIKPTNESTFADIVDLLDEMAIAKLKRYAFMYELSPSEQALLNMPFYTFDSLLNN